MGADQSPDMGSSRMPEESSTTATTTDAVTTDTDDDGGKDWKAEANKWKSFARKHEERVKQMSDYDQLKSVAEQYNRLVEASKTEHEMAIDKARAETTEQMRREYGGRLVQAQIAAAAAGRLPDAQRDALLEGLDCARFLDSKGEPDAEKIAAFVERVAPPPRMPDLGQGRRPAPSKPIDMNQVIRRAAGVA